MIKQIFASISSRLFSRRKRNDASHGVIDELLKIGGWTRKEQLEYLMRQVRKLPDYSVIVEIGVWQGRSAIAMGEACRGTNKRVYAVDPWMDYETMNGLLSTRLGEFGVESIDSVYQGFLSNIARHGLEKWVEPIRSTSIDFASRWSDAAPDFVFIDGNHNYDPVMADLRAWTKLAKKGAVIAGDDWKMDSVRSAVNHYIDENPGLSLGLPCINTWEFVIR